MNKTFIHIVRDLRPKLFRAFIYTVLIFWIWA